METSWAKRVVVTGASTGIGAATVRALSASNWDVIAVARREDKLMQLAAETGAHAMTADITRDADVERLKKQVLDGGRIDAVVNNAGGAFGVDPVAEGRLDDWEQMHAVNVLGALRVSQAFLPALRSIGEGSLVFVTSTAADAAYEGGGGYVAAKKAERALAQTLRLEEAVNNVRVVEIAPGLVHTEEFSLNRLGGDRQAADDVYQGVKNPLVAEDIADVIAYSLGLPHHVNLDRVVVRPVAQAANHKLIRE